MSFSKEFVEQKVRPAHGTDVLVRATYPTEIKSESGIIISLTPEVVNDRPTKGEVIRVGSKVEEVKVGDIVAWDKTSGINLYKEDDVAYIILAEEKILGIYE